MAIKMPHKKITFQVIFMGFFPYFGILKTVRGNSIDLTNVIKYLDLLEFYRFFYYIS